MPTVSAKNSRQHLILTGPTGVGKTAIAIEAALFLKAKYQLELEIISADARAVYPGVALATATPSLKEQKGVKHWGLAIADSKTRFSVHDWQLYAQEKILEIEGRGHEALIVGGTGLYVDALAFAYQFRPENKRQAVDRKAMRKDFRIMFAQRPRTEMRQRLEERARRLYQQKSQLEKEYRQAQTHFPVGHPIFSANALVALRASENEEDYVQKNARLDYQLMRRQETWFRRNEQVIWVNAEEALSRVIAFYENMLK